MKNNYFWSLVEVFITQFSNLIVGIILARLLEPSLFGVLAIIMIFVAVSQIFVESGFGQALIREELIDSIDYSTVFFSNIVIAVFVYLLIFLSSNQIEKFFEAENLALYLEISSLVIIINAFSLIQRTLISKKKEFNKLAKVAFISNIFSGTIAIIVAMLGFGIWSLIIKLVLQYSLYSIVIWSFSQWTPIFKFSYKRLKYFWTFSSKVLLSGLLDFSYKYSFNILIGKLYSPLQLGLFSKAMQLQETPSSGISWAIKRVSYVQFSQYNKDYSALKIEFTKIMTASLLVIGSSLLFLFISAKNLIVILLGKNWIDAVPFLQFLSLIGIFTSYQFIANDIFLSIGKPNIYLALNSFNKIFSVLIVLSVIFISIDKMLFFLLLYNFFVTVIIIIIISNYLKIKITNYFSSQLRILIPLLIMTASLYYINELSINNYFIVFIQLICFLSLSSFLYYKYIKNY